MAQSFDELLLLKRGGRVIFFGPLGHHSSDLVGYFHDIKGVKRIQDQINPATWMLQVTRAAEESRLALDFADFYQQSDLSG